LKEEGNQKTNPKRKNKMEKSKSWLVSLDLTNMDDLLLGYTSFLASKLNPEKITFLHILESANIPEDIEELFPEIEETRDLSSVIREDLEEKISSAFKGFESTRLVLDEGDPTNVIISQIKKQHPDLLIMGKKEKFKGEGVLSKKIVRYVPGSVLFVPESVRYQLDQILTPFNFNDHSAAAIRFSGIIANTAGANVLLQHVYDYPAQFFPYLPSEKFEEKMSNQLHDKFDGFKKEKDLSEKSEVAFTLNKQDRIQNKIYDKSIQIQADLIVVGSKSKRSVASFLHEDLSDKIVNYSFGIPLLVYKDKSKNKGLLDSLLGS